jgi:hypothetical protein
MHGVGVVANDNIVISMEYPYLYTPPLPRLGYVSYSVEILCQHLALFRENSQFCGQPSSYPNRITNNRNRSGLENANQLKKVTFRSEDLNTVSFVISSNIDFSFVHSNAANFQKIPWSFSFRAPFSLETCSQEITNFNRLIVF